MNRVLDGKLMFHDMDELKIDIEMIVALVHYDVTRKFLRKIQDTEQGANDRLFVYLSSMKHLRHIGLSEIIRSG
ncbi:hypothetical protein N7513_004736 [Penicillium frequentans]|uniref:Uncharacterized protein n=1 Tax=Penicillium frequentans TaxID=3151616 RepID=A0AAD6D6A4_9EURO|nr:hypothetical protein N7513_004736 [Penicillium glabrum]KAJ5556702.1 hypothetical protein N7494_000617 [Penicillium glabrum]